MLNVAIVEDDPLFREVMVFRMERFGYRIAFCASNGDDMMLKLVNCRVIPQYFIVDLEMPVKNGFETVTEIRKEMPDARILCVSSTNRMADKIKILACGADGFLSKASTDEELYKALHLLNHNGFYLDDATSRGILNFLRSNAGSLQVH